MTIRAITTLLSTHHPSLLHTPLHLHTSQPVPVAQQPARSTHIHRRHHLVSRHQPLPNPARAEELALNLPMKRTCTVSRTSSCKQSSMPLTPRTENPRSTSAVLRPHSPRELHGRDPVLPRFQTDLRGVQLFLQFPPFRLLQTTKRQHQRAQSTSHPRGNPTLFPPSRHGPPSLPPHSPRRRIAGKWPRRHPG